MKLQGLFSVVFALLLTLPFSSGTYQTYTSSTTFYSDVGTDYFLENFNSVSGIQGSFSFSGNGFSYVMTAPYYAPGSENVAICQYQNSPWASASWYESNIYLRVDYSGNYPYAIGGNFFSFSTPCNFVNTGSGITLVINSGLPTQFTVTTPAPTSVNDFFGVYASFPIHTLFIQGPSDHNYIAVDNFISAAKGVPPTANPDYYTFTENSANNLFDVTANDVQHPLKYSTPSALTVTMTAQHGNITQNSGSSYFTPDPYFYGVASFEYTITDGGGLTASSIVNITVTQILPVATNDSFSLIENAAQSDYDALSNDNTTLTGATLTISSVDSTIPSGCGSASINNGLLSFTPTAGFHGQCSAAYHVTDGHGGTTTAQAIFTITQVLPVAGDDSYTILVNAFQNDYDVLSNDNTTLSGATLNISSVDSTTPSGCGLASVSNNGAMLSFTPTTGFIGQCSAIYHINDGFTGVAAAQVTFNVINVMRLSEEPNAQGYFLASQQGSINVTVTQDVGEISSSKFVLTDGNQVNIDLYINPGLNIPVRVPLAKANSTVTWKVCLITSLNNVINSYCSNTFGVSLPPRIFHHVFRITPQFYLSRTRTFTLPVNTTDDINISISTINVQHGTIDSHSGLSFTYTAPAYFNGTDRLDYTVCNELSICTTSWSNINVAYTAPNCSLDASWKVSKSQVSTHWTLSKLSCNTTFHDKYHYFSAVSSNSDIANFAITGSAGANSTIVMTLNPNHSGVVSWNATLSSLGGESYLHTFSVRVPNNLPTLTAPFTQTWNHLTASNIPSMNLLVNCTDIDGDACILHSILPGKGATPSTVKELGPLSIVYTTQGVVLQGSPDGNIQLLTAVRNGASYTAGAPIDVKSFKGLISFQFSVGDGDLDQTGNLYTWSTARISAN
eukprot:TRINITY_DN3532_c0_g1_i1.p1 TRINITY_DN3532_c0_g1~~TRINITY_DN3532_c0_g1_i1.p1  ORF type:complete len:901 (-),score=179.05 TRINITY_DN3532_c0_g1_i1:118-2820(-)